MRGVSIGIKRSGSNVQITLQCDGDDQAIKIHDCLVEAAMRGEVTINLKTRSGTVDSERPAPKAH
jgi:hypothetical protein